MNKAEKLREIAIKASGATEILNDICEKCIEEARRGNFRLFTSYEMLIVLLIISVLLLLFIPNLSKQREKIETQGSAALNKVVHTQVELYKLETSDGQVTWNKLEKGGYLTAEQIADAKKHKISLE